MSEQLSLFPPETGSISVAVGLSDDKRQGTYMAKIADGWWISYGDTADKAIKSVVKIFEQEMR